MATTVSIYAHGNSKTYLPNRKYKSLNNNRIKKSEKKDTGKGRYTFAHGDRSGYRCMKRTEKP
ncbi:hypothetical protein JCM6292_3049 [Bacteroides pyogenes JCM 6292]|uniref:Uncharacterized protein n=2 Tax=Bacteroides pyogenes TaxID=310300 RepID=W4PJI5_9BACE|nr:hypothetical protein JCM6292_3049 [Bacteroides pyogenes JCM 6292]GAE19966.1 hypothetical protein JCM6294_3088 [Bacteroides pyogenes DSM 20611 = JCM 6294]